MRHHDPLCWVVRPSDVTLRRHRQRCVRRSLARLAPGTGSVFANLRPSAPLHPTIAAPVDVTPVVGLSNAEAHLMLLEYGPNATPESPRIPCGCRWPSSLRPVPCLLKAAIVLQLFLKEYGEPASLPSCRYSTRLLDPFTKGRAGEDCRPEVSIGPVGKRAAMALGSMSCLQDRSGRCGQAFPR